MTEKLLTLHSVEDMVGFKKSRIYELMKTGEFPKNKTIKGKSVWLLSEIQNWIQIEWKSAS